MFSPETFNGTYQEFLIENCDDSRVESLVIHQDAYFVSESIGNLSNLTSLDLSRCHNLTSFPTSLHSLSHLKTPFIIAGLFPIPSDMDWSEFKREANGVYDENEQDFFYSRRSPGIHVEV